MNTLLCACIAGLLSWAPASAADPARPNVIVIMADDLGAEGLASYGSTIYTTPHLDQMAAEGMRFNNAYATPLCTPSRVMLMTGVYPERAGFNGLMGKKAGVRLPASIPTFGNYFRDAGYATAIAGKWQLGKFDEFPDQPVEHGFDRYCMWTWYYGGKKPGRYHSPQIAIDGEIFNGTPKDYGPDIYSRFILDFIDENKDKPFFVYYPMALVHSPFDDPPALRELAEKKYTDGMDKTARKFGHMVTYMDDIVGKILAKLKEHGLDDNTLVVFTADNGTDARIVSKLPDMELRGGKFSLTEAGLRVPFIARWPGVIKPSVNGKFISLVDVLPTLTSMIDVPLKAEVDGMDLSHYFRGTPGKDRESMILPYRGCLVRSPRFRLNVGGGVSEFYDIPITSDRERYGEKKVTGPEFDEKRKELQALIDREMAKPPLYDGAIKSEFSPKLKDDKKSKNSEGKTD